MRGKKQSTADRAVERFGEFALYVRGEMRARGVRGDLPQMDRYVRTERGRGYARFLHDFVQHVKQASGGAVPPDVLTQQLDALSADVVRDVYRHPPAA
ncbi:MAG: hypothetical protein ACK6DP_05120 [Gemmatimonas sp.]|jgi:hypothetical protein|uniref:hypothetical protein n=1 Tax=Gemmatimonas sp. TaxID=1962908 RepID=UPI00391FC133